MNRFFTPLDTHPDIAVVLKNPEDTTANLLFQRLIAISTVDQMMDGYMK